MAAHSRRGFRIRLILEEFNDFRKKCYFFVNVFREKYIRNVVHRIWNCFYNEICSSPDDVILAIDDFFIPPGESTLVLRENDIISVRLRPHAADAAAAVPSGAVRTTVAPLTAAPGTLVESVALVLRRLQDAAGPDDSQRSERRRLLKVAEMMAAESGSTDVSTDEEGVRDLARQLTTRQEVVRLSQKMADQATPPPPCATRQHDLDSDRLTLTEVSRELRRRYEAARLPPAAAAARAVAIEPLDSVTATLETAAPDTSTTSGAATSTPLSTPAAAWRGPEGVSVVRRPAADLDGSRGAMEQGVMGGVDGGAALRPATEADSAQRGRCVKVVRVTPPGLQKNTPGDVTSTGATTSAPVGQTATPSVVVVQKPAPNVAVAQKLTPNVVVVQKLTPNVVVLEKTVTAPLPTETMIGQRQPAGVITVGPSRDVASTPVAREQPPQRCQHSRGTDGGGRQDPPVAGLKRARSPSSESDDSDGSPSEDESPAKPSTASKPATPATPTAGSEASSEKKKKTRTRRRRGKKRRGPEPPAVPQPAPRPADYAQRHGLPRADIDRYKRAASVGIGWQTRPKNRRVVFDDDGNAVPAEKEVEPAARRSWGSAESVGARQWPWSRGGGEEQAAGGGKSDRGDAAKKAEDLRGDCSVSGDRPGCRTVAEARSGSVSTSGGHSGSQTPAEQRGGNLSLCEDAKRLATEDTSINLSETNSCNNRSALTDRPTEKLADPSGDRSEHRASQSGRPGEAVRDSGGCRRTGPLGAGLLPRAFMRPRRCVDPPRRSDVLRATKTAASTAAVEAPPPPQRRTNADGGAGVAGTSGRLLMPDYLVSSRAATADAGSRDATRTPTDVDCTSSPATRLPAPPAGVEGSDNTPQRPRDSRAAAATRSGAAAVAVPQRTVVLDGRGRPAVVSAARDLRHLAASAERQPLLVVRRDRPLPGRAACLELTRQGEGRQHSGGTGSAAPSSRANGEGGDEGREGGRSSGENGGRRGPRAGEEDDWREGLRAGGEDGGGETPGTGGEDGGGDGPRAVEEDGTGGGEDVDPMSSPSGDVYSNVSVIIAGRPLEALSSSGQSSSDSGEDSGDQGEDSEEAQSEPEAEPTMNGRHAAASVDSITNCNVVNAVGQNRRLEKQRARSLPSGGGKENVAPAAGVKDDKFYSQFPLMREVAHKRDLIAFKCWDMAEDYTPYVSDYKEATVMEVAEGDGSGCRLTLQLLEYRPRGRRRGRFEITSPEDDEVIDLEEESGIEQRVWSELIQPRLLHP